MFPPAVEGSFTLNHRGLAGLRAFSIPAYAGSITEVVARRKLDSELSIPAQAGSFTLNHRGLAGLRAFSIPAYAESITEVTIQVAIVVALSIPAHAGSVTKQLGSCVD